MTAEPPDSPVSEGVRSLEVRWIFPGQLTAAVARWFGRFPAEVESREDTYLLDPPLPGLSVKVRGGGALEVKVFRGSPGMLEVGAVQRAAESCRWSFPSAHSASTALSPVAGGESARRRISRFSSASGRVVALAAGLSGRCAMGSPSPAACRTGGRWGSGGQPRDLLRRPITTLIPAQALPGGAQPGPDESSSYAQWLSLGPGAGSDAHA